MHPMLSRAFKILEPMFIESIIPEDGQGLLADEESWIKLLETLLSLKPPSPLRAKRQS